MYERYCCWVVGVCEQSWKFLFGCLIVRRVNMWIGIGPGTSEIKMDAKNGSGDDPLLQMNPFVASMKPSGTGFISDLARTLKSEGRCVLEMAMDWQKETRTRVCSSL